MGWELYRYYTSLLLRYLQTEVACISVVTHVSATGPGERASIGYHSNTAHNLTSSNLTGTRYVRMS